jgi:hypothetical protein
VIAVEQAIRTPRVEPHYPVPDDLKPDPADLRRLATRRTVIDRRQRQKPSACGLSLVLLAEPRSSPAPKPSATGPQPTWRTPPFAMLNQSQGDLGILEGVRLSGIWY